jgi:meiotically up-regulated gene 157 (Mug157) protein
MNNDFELTSFHIKMQKAYTRREVLKSVAASPFIFSTARIARADQNFASRRPPQSRRKFTSRAVEELLSTVKAKIADPELAWMFENCYPNTLDTTVTPGVINGKPDTFVITGDIDAMWLRDSSCQVWPYLQLAKVDADLRLLFQGLIARQTRCILLDPYANAFLYDSKSKPLSWAVGDLTEMRPGVAERKWEVDSLCYCIRLAHAYWRATEDSSPFGADWLHAMQLVTATFREQQRKSGHGNYHFQRRTETPTDTQALGGYGNPARPVGMIYSMFRPSDDACIYPLFVPANLFAMVSLRQLAQMASAIPHDDAFSNECNALATEIESAAAQYGRMSVAGQEVWAYEVDGFGNQLFIDDANTPGLLGLPYLGCCSLDDALYRRTRIRILSDANPYFFKGKVAEGIGGPHEAMDMIWPMSIIMRALTSTDDDEIRQCLRWIKASHAGTGFIHETFHKDDATRFTRSWFAWANSLFGELIVKLSQERPWILKNAERH